MAWLQSLSENLSHLFASGPEEDGAVEPDIAYLEKVNTRDLNPDLAARQREYVGSGTQSRVGVLPCCSARLLLPKPPLRLP